MKEDNKYIKELATVRGCMLDILYDSCSRDIKEIFGKSVDSELKALESRESKMIRKLKIAEKNG